MAIAVHHDAPAAPADSGADARFKSLTLDFLSYLELERGLSRNTLNAYRTDLFQYGEYLSAHHLDALKARPAEVGSSSPSWRPAARRNSRAPPRRSTARPPACAPSTSTCAATS